MFSLVSRKFFAMRNITLYSVVCYVVKWKWLVRFVDWLEKIKPSFAPFWDPCICNFKWLNQFFLKFQNLEKDATTNVPRYLLIGGIYMIKASVCLSVCPHSNVQMLTSPPILKLWDTQGYLWLPYDLTKVIKLIGETFWPTNYCFQKNTLCHSFQIIVIPSRLLSFLPNIVIPSKLLPFEIFVILNTSCTLPYPKGEKIGRQSRPYLRVYSKSGKNLPHWTYHDYSCLKRIGLKHFPMNDSWFQSLCDSNPCNLNTIWTIPSFPDHKFGAKWSVPKN